jgi:hypothetical protein
MPCALVDVYQWFGDTAGPSKTSEDVSTVVSHYRDRTQNTQRHENLAPQLNNTAGGTEQKHGLRSHCAGLQVWLSVSTNSPSFTLGLRHTDDWAVRNGGRGGTVGYAEAAERSPMDATNGTGGAWAPPAFRWLLYSL